MSFANTHIALLTLPPPLLSALVLLPPHKWPHYAFIGKYLNISVYTLVCKSQSGFISRDHKPIRFYFCDLILSIWEGALFGGVLFSKDFSFCILFN